MKAVVQGGSEPFEGNIMKYHMHWLVLNSSSYHTFQELVANGHKPKIAICALGICSDLENDLSRTILMTYGHLLKHIKMLKMVK